MQPWETERTVRKGPGKAQLPGVRSYGKEKKSAVPKKAATRPAKRRKATSNALEILHRRYFEGKPERMREIEEARAEDEVARKIYKLRTAAGFSQREFAKLVGTTASVICRLEDADYEGHSLAMLRRIAAALDKRVEIRYVSLKTKTA